MYIYVYVGDDGEITDIKGNYFVTNYNTHEKECYARKQ